MTEKEVFYPAEEYYKKQNNCEFYLVKTDYKLLMIDDIVRILNNQRETIQYHRKTEKQLEKEHTRLTNQLRLSYDKINKLTDENEQLKQLLDYAEDLIQSHLSEHFIRQWRNFKTGHKEYNDFWEEKLKKHNELKGDVE